MGGPDGARRSRVQFTKRCKTLKRKAHELADFCDANVYLVIIHPRENYTYNSASSRSWPPPDEELVSVGSSDKEFRTKWLAGTTLSWLKASAKDQDETPKEKSETSHSVFRLSATITLFIRGYLQADSGVRIGHQHSVEILPDDWRCFSHENNLRLPGKDNSIATIYLRFLGCSIL